MSYGEEHLITDLENTSYVEEPRMPDLENISHVNEFPIQGLEQIMYVEQLPIPNTGLYRTFHTTSMIVCFVASTT